MAHIRRHPISGNWQVRYRDPNGHERSKNFDRKVDAQKFKAMQEGDKARGVYVDVALGKTKLEPYALEWLQSRTHLHPGTIHNLEARLHRHILPAIGNRAIANIRPGDIRGFVSQLTDKGLSPSTVKATYFTLCKILKTAEVDGLIAKSPCVGIDLPKETHHQEMRFLEPPQIQALAEAVDPRYRALIYTAAYTGMRWGELAGLRVANLNLLKGTVHVAEALSERKGHLYFGPPKNGKPRTISLPRFLAEMLGEHIGRYPSDNLTEGGSLVFTAAEGGPLRRTWYRRHFKPAVVEAGLDPAFRFHDLRHSCAALLIAQGAHPKEIQERMGHSTIRLTFDRYGHLFPSLDDRLRDGLDEAFRGAADSSRTGAEKEAPAKMHRGPSKRPATRTNEPERATRFELATLTLAR